MFLLFRWKAGTEYWAYGIYIPICFYYFTKACAVSGYFSNLHSNMFLLFQFALFWFWWHKHIYIPICFYYFALADKKLMGIMRRFTFQYVSIISACNTAGEKMESLFTFQYVSIISISVCALFAILTSFTFQYVSIISAPAF